MAVLFSLLFGCFVGFFFSVQFHFQSLNQWHFMVTENNFSQLYPTMLVGYASAVRTWVWDTADASLPNC